jgi:putative ABC transport system permease protein
MRGLGFGWTALVLAAGAVRRNPLRSALTAFGILIGVAAVTVVVALGEGATQAVAGRIDSLGENALIVVPEETARSGVRDAAPPLLTEADALALREAPAVAATAPILSGSARVAWRDANAGTQIVGSTLDFFRIRVWSPAAGELWPVSAETLGEKVCVIGATVKTDLFGGQDAVGHLLRIGQQSYRVVAVMEAKGQGPFGGDQDDVVVMPIGTMRARLTPTRPGQVHRVLMSASSAARTESARRQASEILRQRHHLIEGTPDDFEIRSQEDFRKMQAAILGVLGLLLLAIAAVSLLVGGIGVMNIMLVSVAERTREIGIRMAIGAREGDILLQFLVEAMVLALIGGLGGAALAALGVQALAGWLEWQMAVSARALAVALATSSAVGILFGFLPARRAARLDPIQALGRE